MMCTQEYKEESVIVSLRFLKLRIIKINMVYFESEECVFIEKRVRQRADLRKDLYATFAN